MSGLKDGMGKVENIITEDSKGYSIILKNSGKFNVLSYYTDKENPELKGLNISGVAITVGKHNDVNYTKEELQAVVPQFMGKQLRADHSTSIFDVIGKVTNSYWDAWHDSEGNQEGIKFDAIVTNEQVARNIKMGVTDGFSAGFGVDKIVKKKGELYASGLTPLELSHVCEPADERSRLTELYNSKQVSAYLEKIKEEDTMVEEEKKLQDEVPAAEAPVEQKPAVSLEEVLAMVKELSDRLSAIEGMKKEEKPAEQAPEVPAEQMAKDETSELKKKVSELEEALSKVEIRKTVMTKESAVKKLCKQDSPTSWVLIK